MSDLEFESDTEIHQSTSFPCTVDGCDAHFPTRDLLEAHQRTDPDHEYCSKCKLCFADWDSYVHHRYVDLVHQKDKIKICPVCGAEFRSRSGRDKHLAQHRSIDQTITCVSCMNVFRGPSSFINHIEGDQCSQLSKADLQSSLYRNHVAHVGMNDFDEEMLEDLLILDDSDSVSSPPSTLPPQQIYLPREFTVPDLDVDVLYRHDIHLYACPDPACGSAFAGPQEITDHLFHAHINCPRRQCPECRKSFKTIAALVAHVTSTEVKKCKLQKRKSYFSILASLTGGLMPLPERREKGQQTSEHCGVHHEHDGQTELSQPEELIG